MMRVLPALILCVACGCSSERAARTTQSERENPMELGNFSVSLAVKDLAASAAFYEKLGFTKFGGDGKTWLIMQNSTATIGLFQGMFEKNILTFNPGWDRGGQTLPRYTDIRELQRTLEARGIPLATRADEKSDGPASLVITDPDGNPILIDQHVPKPQ